MKTLEKQKVIVVLPAYNAEKTLEKTIRDIPAGCADEIILVDDKSRDGTVTLARKLGLTVFVHEKNLGYGGNQKTCYTQALKRKADIVVMIHPDYQYDPRVLPALTLPIKLGICDIMLGNRIRSRGEVLKNRMPLYKYISNRFLTIVENIVLDQNLGEFHSGMRAYSARVLETLPFMSFSDDFVFDSQFLMHAVLEKFIIGDLPVPVRYMKEASSINFFRSLTYGIATMMTLVKFMLIRIGLVRYGKKPPQGN